MRTVLGDFMLSAATETSGLSSHTRTAWDYLVISVHARHNPVLEEQLNLHGDEGWELSFLSMPMANEYHCIFRRTDTSPAMQWDYSVITIHARQNATLEEGLRVRGHEGWELCFMNIQIPTEYQCVFRRPRSDQSTRANQPVSGDERAEEAHEIRLTPWGERYVVPAHLTLEQRERFIALVDSGTLHWLDALKCATLRENGSNDSE
jgi:hypothetical protein